MNLFTTSDVADIIDRSPLGKLQIRTLLLCLIIAALDGFDTQCIAFVAPTIGKEWGVARGNFGPVFSASLAGSVLGSLFLAPLGDRFGRKPVIQCSLICFAIFSLLSAFATNLGELTTYRGLTGLGLGMVYPNLIALAFEYSPHRRRTFLTAAASLGLAPGGMIGGVLSAVLIPSYGWKSVFVLGGVLPLVMVPLVAVYLPESIRFLSARPNRRMELTRNLSGIDPTGDYRAAEFSPLSAEGYVRASVARLFSEGRGLRTSLLWLAFAANLFMLNFMINWLPSVLHEAGLPIAQAILETTVFNLGGIVGGLICAAAIDRLKSYKMLLAAYCVTALAISSVGVFSHSPIALFTAIFLSGGGVIGAFAGINVLAGALYPTAARATGLGWAFGVGRVGSVLGPVAGGMIVSFGWSIQATFLFGAAPALIAVAAVAGIIAGQRSSPQDTAQPVA